MQDAESEVGQQLPATGTGNRSQPKISLDYLLENCRNDTSGAYNPYITEFSRMPFVSDISHLAREYYPVRQLMNHRHLKKELAESLGAIFLAERAMRQLDSSRIYNSDLIAFEALKLHQDRIVFYDICCGKGILSFLLTFLFPRSKIVMLDNNTSMNLEYLSDSRFSNTSFLCVDLFSDAAFDLIKEKTEEAQQLGFFTLAFGLHLCGHLSPRLVHFFNEIQGISALIVSPCCMPARRKGGKQINDMIRKTKWSGYDYWCLSVYTAINGALARKDIVRDENVISEKSTSILATKQLTTLLT